ncbi:helix-turn-helix transcriptional regulator [Roseibium porphyridii]|uniref:Helix-turn-helix transcriptional regulator n=1 Tax=Roseibium porphyridii TaxID=2866279 RepID=A0ABY8F0P8_9HYPH|nr:AraC family transcriptional regulator [Roseibium sp. KMA01]WFE89037.1 helix-turn-helix transcriptional regulator [Roseibium sp. KMA01]
MIVREPRSIFAAGHQVKLLAPGAYDTSYVAAGDSIGFAFDAQSGSHAIGTDRSAAFYRDPNTFAGVPNGCDVRSSSRSGGEYLLVSGPQIAVSAKKYRSNIRADRTRALADQLRYWVISGQMPDVLAAENTFRQISAVVAKPKRDPKAARWMTPRRFRQLTETVEAKLEGPLTVAALAEEIGVSASFLSRAFKAYCGQSPYDFILSRRLQRARQLLEATQHSIATIALASGFSSQSHMTSVMRARLGVNPTMIRRP